MSHPVGSAHIPKDLTLDHGRIVYFERLFPPQKVYKQRTYCMTKCVQLQQTNGNTLRD